MKTNDHNNKSNKFTIGTEDYLKPDGYMLQLITRFIESTPSQLQAIIASPWRGSRYRVLNVPLWPVCSCYKCPLRCLLEPELQSRRNFMYSGSRPSLHHHIHTCVRVEMMLFHEHRRYISIDMSESDNQNVGWTKCVWIAGSLANYANNQIKSDKCASFCSWQVFSAGTKHRRQTFLG